MSDLDRMDQRFEELDDKFVVTVAPVEISPKRVADLITCALEGGSNYWYMISNYEFTGDITRDDLSYPHIETPFYRGCSIIIDVTEDEDGELSGRKLNWDSLQRGLQVMHDKYRHHWDNFVQEDDDAETGDVFLQCCLFGELVFG